MKEHFSDFYWDEQFGTTRIAAVEGRRDRNSRGGADATGAGLGGNDPATGGRNSIVARRDSANERDDGAAIDCTESTTANASTVTARSAGKASGIGQATEDQAPEDRPDDPVASG